jgi:hypothetical protein
MNDNKRCWYTIPRPFRRAMSRCRRKAIEGSHYCTRHICSCGIGPFTHKHEEVK